MWSLSLNKLHRNFFWALCLLLPVQLGYHFWPQSGYVMGLRIDYLAPTIYLTDILVLVILVLWGLEKLKIQNLKLSILPISVFIFLIISSLLAQNSGAALYKFAKIIEFSLLGLYVAKNSYKLRVISYKLAFAVIYSSLLALAQFIKQSSLGGIFWWLGERTFTAATPGIAKAVVNGELIMRPYATFPHPNVLAGFLLISLILTVPYFFPKQNFLATGYVLLAALAIILSFSRSVWLVGLILILFLLFRNKKFFLIISSLFLVISCLLLVTSYSADETISQRLQLGLSAMAMIRANPLAGVGLNNFLVRLPEFWGNIGATYWLQPVHNIYLLIAAETGITGLMIFLWFLFLTFKKLSIINYQLPRSGKLRLSIALSSILLLGLFDHYWLTLQQTQLLLAIVLGLSWGRERSKI